ncbi:HPr family phosphocarrier protein [Microbacterium sp. NPDC019599]|uniref:HPr family phosphocarrier protein n=1 Tax=Microbacterium sp. NPDC019599 TaxID=3154690 RepID=UPI0033C48CE4
MIGIVVVSHSPALARAAVEVALEMAAASPPPVRVAAGAAGGATGTDAVAIAAAIDEVASPDGVLVLMDLGSAVLSSGMALEFVTTDAPVVLSAAPFVDGLIAAVVTAASGADLATVDAEATRALEAKAVQLDRRDAVAPDANPAAAEAEGACSFEAVIRNASGLHARPAATFVKTAGLYDARVTVTDLDSGSGPVSATSLASLMALGVGQGTRVRIEATGPQAAEAAGELAELVAAGFGEL